MADPVRKTQVTWTEYEAVEKRADAPLVAVVADTHRATADNEKAIIADLLKITASPSGTRLDMGAGRYLTCNVGEAYFLDEYDTKIVRQGVTCRAEQWTEGASDHWYVSRDSIVRYEIESWAPRGTKLGTNLPLTDDPATQRVESATVNVFEHVIK